MTDSSAKVIIENMEFNKSIAYYDFSFNSVSYTCGWRGGRVWGRVGPPWILCPWVRFPGTSLCTQMTASVVTEMAEMQLKLPHLTFLLVGANSLNREEFRELMKANKDVIALTAGVNPRLRFKPFPK